MIRPLHAPSIALVLLGEHGGGPGPRRCPAGRRRPGRVPGRETPSPEGRPAEGHRRLRQGDRSGRGRSGPARPDPGHPQPGQMAAGPQRRGRAGRRGGAQAGPGDSDALLARGAKRACTWTGRTKRSPTSTPCSRPSPGTASALLYRGRAREWFKDDRAGAKADYDAALAIDPKSVRVYMQRAGLLLDERSRGRERDVRGRSGPCAGGTRTSCCSWAWRWNTRRSARRTP